MKTRLIPTGTPHSKYTIKDLKGMGWTDKQIIDEGFALPVPMQFSTKPTWDMAFIGANRLVLTWDINEKLHVHLYEFLKLENDEYTDANGEVVTSVKSSIEKHPSITKMTEDSVNRLRVYDGVGSVIIEQEAKFGFTGFTSLPSWDRAYKDATYLIKLDNGLYVFAETNEHGDMLTNEGDEFENWTLVSERPIEPVKVDTVFGPATLHVGKAPSTPVGDAEQIMNRVSDNLEKFVTDTTEPVNRYKREILPGVWIDFYDIAACYEMTDHAMTHALKKMLAMGNRGFKDEAQDRKDIYDSVVRSNERYEIFNNQPTNRK